MEKKMIVVPKYTTLRNGSMIKTGYRAYSVILDNSGKVIRSFLKKEK